MKNVMISMMFVLSLGLVGCGQNPHIWQTQVTSTSTVTVTTTSTQLQQVLDQENGYLESVGQHDLISGLACSLYTVPTSTTSIAQVTNSCGLSNQATFPYTGVFNQPQSNVNAGLNVLPIALQSQYQTWFVLKCNGYLINLDNAYHQFSLTSDDGSLLYVDGLLVNNDGLHSTQTVNASKLMTVGAHYFEIDFFQGTGLQSLVLNEDGQVLDPSKLYH